MKLGLYIVFSLVLISGTQGQTASGSFDIYNGDTINFKDDNGKKQGWWIIFGKSSSRHRGFAPDAKVEEGEYVNSRKTGIWKKYWPNENLRSEITYKSGRPNGPFTSYYEEGEGKIEEKGTWKGNRYTGSFERRHRNGEVAQKLEFNESGKREGKQQFFYENGQVELEFSVNNGIENGELNRYYPNGDLKETKIFNNGQVDPTSIKNYDPVKPEVVIKEDPVVPVKTAKTDEELKPNAAVGFVKDGYNKLYNKSKQITQDGIFKRGKLNTGKWYRYNSDGILQRIEKYRNGYYIGDAPIEDK